LKPERWGSLLVQEKYQAEKTCENRHPYRIVIIIKPDTDELCRCGKESETMQNSTAACEKLTPTGYV